MLLGIQTIHADEQVSLESPNVENTVSVESKQENIASIDNESQNTLPESQQDVQKDSSTSNLNDELNSEVNAEVIENSEQVAPETKITDSNENTTNYEETNYNSTISTTSDSNNESSVFENSDSSVDNKSENSASSSKKQLRQMMRMKT